MDMEHVASLLTLHVFLLGEYMTMQGYSGSHYGNVNKFLRLTAGIVQLLSSTMYVKSQSHFLINK